MPLGYPGAVWSASLHGRRGLGDGGQVGGKAREAHAHECHAHENGGASRKRRNASFQTAFRKSSFQARSLIFVERRQKNVCYNKDTYQGSAPAAA